MNYVNYFMKTRVDQSLCMYRHFFLYLCIKFKVNMLQLCRCMWNTILFVTLKPIHSVCVPLFVRIFVSLKRTCMKLETGPICSKILCWANCEITYKLHAFYRLFSKRNIGFETPSIKFPMKHFLGTFQLFFKLVIFYWINCVAINTKFD